jgi:hypothetical protein
MDMVNRIEGRKVESKPKSTICDVALITYLVENFLTYSLHLSNKICILYNQSVVEMFMSNHQKMSLRTCLIDICNGKEFLIPIVLWLDSHEIVLAEDTLRLIHRLTFEEPLLQHVHKAQ